MIGESMRGRGVAASGLVIIGLAAALVLLMSGPAAAQGSPTVFDAPNEGGHVMGVSGTSDPSVLAEAQTFEVHSITAYVNGTTRTYWPDRPDDSTLEEGDLREESLVVIRRVPPPPPPEPDPTPAPTPAPTATPAPTPPPAATPAPPPEPGSRMLALEQALQTTIANNPINGVVAVAVRDLQTGERVGVMTDEYWLAGCVINLFVIMQAVLDVQAGDIPLSRVDRLIRDTTWSSNPVTARELYRIVGNGDVIRGLARVEQLIRQELGQSRIILNHAPGYFGTSEELGRNPNNWLTAEGVNAGLDAIINGGMFDAEHRRYLLGVLGEVKPGLNYLTATVPGAVSHKNGFLHAGSGYVDNDAAIVRFRSNDRTYSYAITLLFARLPEQYAHIPLGQQLAAVTWQHMTDRYR